MHRERIQGYVNFGMNRQVNLQMMGLSAFIFFEVAKVAISSIFLKDLNGDVSTNASME